MLARCAQHSVGRRWSSLAWSLLVSNRLRIFTPRLARLNKLPLQILARVARLQLMRRLQ